MFALLTLAVVFQRLWELQIAGSNEAHLRRRGAVEHGAEHYPFMVGLHAFWLLSGLVEWWNGARLSGQWVLLGTAMFCAGQVLRWATIRTLRRRWTTRVLVLREAPLVREGPFRYLNHPNYLGVVLEIFGFPLIGGCWRTSLTFGLLNLLLLRQRIKVENRALSR